MFARITILYGIIIYLSMYPPDLHAQDHDRDRLVVGEGAAGLFFGEAFGGVTGNIGIALESNGMRYFGRYSYQVDSRAPDFASVQPSRIDVMREVSALVGFVAYNGPGVYSGSAGIGWTWGKYLPPSSSGNFRTVSITVEGFGGVELVKIFRMGFLLRANINGIRTIASINASLGIVLSPTGRARACLP